MDSHDTIKREERPELTVEDVKNILDDTDKFKTLPVVKFSIGSFDIELDRMSVFTTGIVIGLWISLWVFLNIFDYTDVLGNFIFIIYILICLANLWNSATNISDSQIERMNLTSQQNFIQGGLSIFILLLVFIENIKLTPEISSNIYTLIILSLIICCVPIVIINLQNKSTNVRFVRKIQQGLFNQSLMFFILCLLVMYRFKLGSSTKGI